MTDYEVVCVPGWLHAWVTDENPCLFCGAWV